MSGILSPKIPKPPTAPPPPMIDDARSKLNAVDRTLRRQGRSTTILTGESGLPNLGTTTQVGS
jgi:regulator of extracellular matrix RemA (YlzA/DUF370 family)